MDFSSKGSSPLKILGERWVSQRTVLPKSLALSDSPNSFRLSKASCLLCTSKTDCTGVAHVSGIEDANVHQATSCHGNDWCLARAGSHSIASCRIQGVLGGGESAALMVLTWLARLTCTLVYTVSNKSECLHLPYAKDHM